MVRQAWYYQSREVESSADQKPAIKIFLAPARINKRMS